MDFLRAADSRYKNLSVRSTGVGSSTSRRTHPSFQAVQDMYAREPTTATHVLEKVEHTLMCTSAEPILAVKVEKLLVTAVLNL